MLSDATMPVSRRAEELAYVTKHFHDMQGMAGAPSLVPLFLFAFLVRARGFCVWQLWLLPPGLALGVLAAGRIQRWYRKSFGFVAPPKPQVQFSPVLSIVNTPASSPATGARGERGVRLILLISFVVLFSLHRSDRHLPLLNLMFLIGLLLVPRCFYRTPPVVTLQLRRVLSIAVVTLLEGLLVADLWINASKWLVLFTVLGCFLLIVLYDHWLLMRLLGGRRDREAFDAE